MVASEMARRSGLHLVAFDHAGDPSVATRGAFTALARAGRRDRDHRAVALLVLLSAAARTGIVSSNRWRPHFRGEVLFVRKHDLFVRCCERNGHVVISGVGLANTLRTLGGEKIAMLRKEREERLGVKKRRREHFVQPAEVREPGLVRRLRGRGCGRRE